MWDWALIIAAPFLILMVLEEIVQFAWARYIRGPKEQKWERTKWIIQKMKELINTTRKSLSRQKSA